MRALIFTIFACSVSWAFEATLSPRSKSLNSDVIINIKGIGIPREQFKSHLMSGLHSRFEFELTATAKNQSLFKKKIIWQVYYDLWDEVFKVSILTDGASESKAEFKNLESFFKSLENPQFNGISTQVSTKNIDDGSGVLAMRVSLNPVSQETVARMKKWINQRRVPGVNAATIRPGGAAGVSDQSATPKLSGLFNQILGYEMNDAKQNAAWTFDDISKIIVTDGLK